MISEGELTAEDFLESNHKLRVQQQVAREEEEDRSDELEAEELNNLRQASVCSKTCFIVQDHEKIQQKIKNTSLLLFSFVGAAFD